mgnify:CR=1 FL=1
MLISLNKSLAEKRCNNMKLYLDLCVFNRPFDFQGQDRISLETNIFIYILEQIEKGIHELIISDAIIYENEKNPDEQRRIRIESFLQLAKTCLIIEIEDVKRAHIIQKSGFYGIDAFHIALAERANVDYYITCDDNMVKHYIKDKKSIKVPIIKITEFISLEVK